VRPGVFMSASDDLTELTSNAEARAFAEEAARTASTVPRAAGASVCKPSG